MTPEYSARENPLASDNGSSKKRLSTDGGDEPGRRDTDQSDAETCQDTTETTAPDRRETTTQDDAEADPADDRYDPVGVIGIGDVGTEFLHRAHADGYRTVAYDLAPERRSAATDIGATVRESAVAVADESGAVVLALPGTEDVEQVVGDDAFLSALNGAPVLDATTTHPDLGPRCAEWCGSVGSEYIVTQLTRGAPRGGTLLMVGTERKTYDRFRELFDTLGNDHELIGDLVAARRFKLALQMRYALHTAVDAEVVAFARAGGVDPEPFNEFLGMEVSKRFFEEDYEAATVGMGGLDIWHKDLGYALDVAGDIETTLPMTEAGHDLYDVGRRRSSDREPCAEAIAYFWAEDSDV